MHWWVTAGVSAGGERPRPHPPVLFQGDWALSITPPVPRGPQRPQAKEATVRTLSRGRVAACISQAFLLHGAALYACP